MKFETFCCHGCKHVDRLVHLASGDGEHSNGCFPVVQLHSLSLRTLCARRQQAAVKPQAAALAIQPGCCRIMPLPSAQASAVVTTQHKSMHASRPWLPSSQITTRRHPLTDMWCTCIHATVACRQGPTVLMHTSDTHSTNKEFEARPWEHGVSPWLPATRAAEAAGIKLQHRLHNFSIR